MNPDTIQDDVLTTRLGECDSVFSDNLRLFNKDQIAKLLQIFQDNIGKQHLSETDINKLVSDLAYFEGVFFPNNWINPTNITITGSTNQTADEIAMNNLIHKLAENLPNDNEITAYNLSILSPEQQETVKLKGITLNGLFAAALAFDIDPFDPAPAIDINGEKKVEWFAISTEVINIAISIMFLNYNRSNYVQNINPETDESSESAAQKAAIIAQRSSNISLMSDTIGTVDKLSSYLNTYISTGGVGVDSENCPNMSYSDFIVSAREANEELSPLNLDASQQTARVSHDLNIFKNSTTIRNCGYELLKSGLNQLKALDNSYNVLLDVDGWNEEQKQNVIEFINDIGGDGSVITDHQSHLTFFHPVYTLFVINLINLITDIEMQLGTSPYTLINNAMSTAASEGDWATVALINHFESEMPNCSKWYDGPIPTLTSLLTEVNMATDTGSML